VLVSGGAVRFAAAAGLPTGNLNLRLDGYEVITPEGSAPARVSIDAIGQVIADTAGNFSGAETVSAVDPAAPAQAVCNGSVRGTITPRSGAFGSGNGDFSISLTFTPASASTYCIPATTAMQCNRTLLHRLLADDPNAGEYHCIVTAMSAGAGAATIDGASMDGHLDSVRGSNAPTE